MNKLEKDTYYRNKTDGKVQKGISWMIGHNMLKHRPKSERWKVKDFVKVHLVDGDYQEV
jgi:hypothetical protein